VITNLLRAFPYVGSSLVSWLWGGFSVDNPTLTRFYTLHFLLPFVISAFTFLHLFLLHLRGSNNPLGVQSLPDSVAFHWAYVVKDAFGFSVGMTALFFIVFFHPILLIEVDNFIPANPLVTPSHIVPE